MILKATTPGSILCKGYKRSSLNEAKRLAEVDESAVTSWVRETLGGETAHVMIGPKRGKERSQKHT